MFTALVGYLGLAELAPGARHRAEAVLFDVLTPAPVASVEVIWPSDPRARQVANALAAAPADDRSAAAWGPPSNFQRKNNDLPRLRRLEAGVTGRGVRV